MTKDEMATEIMRLQGELSEARADTGVMAKRATTYHGAICAMLSNLADTTVVKKIGEKALKQED